MTTESPAPEALPSTASPTTRPPQGRSWLAWIWYEVVRVAALLYFSLRGGIRATGRQNLPRTGPAFIVSNHLSHLDVFVLGLGIPRPLNYVARSSLFVPPLGWLIRSVGGYPIQREGMGAQGLKETLRRLRAGGLVLLFPEGTRSRDGELGPLKPGIAVLTTRARVPIVPAALAGTFEAWPRRKTLPSGHAIHIHYGVPITPEQTNGMSPVAITNLILDRILDCQRSARQALERVERLS